MYIPDIEPAPGKSDEWILVSSHYMKHEDLTVLIGPGFIFDLASIPRPLRWAPILDKLDRRNWQACLEHDYRYEKRFGPRKNADIEFYRALRRNGISKAKSLTFYAGVRLGGWRAWGSWD